MTSRKKMGGTRECGRARYLPSLIALLLTVSTGMPSRPKALPRLARWRDDVISSLVI